MKILRPGKQPEKIVHRILCPFCECLFEVEQEELESVSDVRDGDYWKINCPCCKREITKSKSFWYSAPGRPDSKDRQ